MTLRSRHRRLDAEIDLIAVAGDDGVLFQGRSGFAGRGVAARIDVPRGAPAAAAKGVHAVLDAIEGAEPGRGPVALGALPFDNAAPATLILPEVLVGRAADGTRWVTTVLPDDAADDDHDRLADSVMSLPGRSGSSGAAAGWFDVRATVRPERWQASLVTARGRLREGAARKVVLAREVLVTADRPLSRALVARRLRATYPGCTLFAIEGFIGASPELLVARSGDIIHARPMAGTAPRSADPSTDARLAAALLSSAKDRIEHRYTIDMVHDTLLPYCSYLDEEAEPSIVAMANVQHLTTTVEGRLSAPAASVIELMADLHPTPAVAGSPRDAALSLIAEHEPVDRGRYAGPVGWVDAQGNGEWVVGIRSAELDGTTARVWAGVGVVADSDPDAELAETRAKLEALLSAIVVV